MTKRLTQHGNSLALILDKPILELVKINADTPLEISTDDGNRLIITPLRADRQKKLRRVVDRMFVKHEKTFRKLAE
jgi:antitoxin component of MazEF toxin-antitoxin module